MRQSITSGLLGSRSTRSLSKSIHLLISKSKLKRVFWRTNLQSRPTKCFHISTQKGIGIGQLRLDWEIPKIFGFDLNLFENNISQLRFAFKCVQHPWTGWIIIHQSGLSWSRSTRRGHQKINPPSHQQVKTQTSIFGGLTFKELLMISLPSRPGLIKSFKEIILIVKQKCIWHRTITSRLGSPKDIWIWSKLI